jgi:hypothetical protein
MKVWELTGSVCGGGSSVTEEVSAISTQCPCVVEEYPYSGTFHLTPPRLKPRCLLESGGHHPVARKKEGI